MTTGQIPEYATTSYCQSTLLQHTTDSGPQRTAHLGHQGATASGAPRIGVQRAPDAQGLHWQIFPAAAAKSLQSCLTLCDPTDGSPPGSPVPGILQARTLEWVAISYSNAWKWKEKVRSLSRVRLPATPWSAAYQAPPSMGFSRQEYWSGEPLPSPNIS